MPPPEPGRPPAPRAESASLSRPQVVDVAWCPDAPVGWAHDAARRLAAAAVGRPESDLHVAHLCPRCGSARHGVPLVCDSRTALPVGVSLARSGAAAVVAVSAAGAVGVDVETVSEERFAGLAPVLLHPAERVGSTAELAQVWSRKEALLKALGTGLTVDPRAVLVSCGDEAPAVLECPGVDPGTVQLRDLDLGPAPAGAAPLVGALAVRRF